MTRFRCLRVVLLAAGASILPLLSAVPLAAAPGTAHRAAYSSLLGYWYMGNGAGWGCFLTLRADRLLSLQRNGDLADMPPVTASWTLQGNRILLKGSDVTQFLGASLRIVRWHGCSVLVPQAQEAALRHAHGYPSTLCFWPNEKGAQGGVKLPSQAWKDSRAAAQPAPLSPGLAPLGHGRKALSH